MKVEKKMAKAKCCIPFVLQQRGKKGSFRDTVWCDVTFFVCRCVANSVCFHSFILAIFCCFFGATPYLSAHRNARMKSVNSKSQFQRYYLWSLLLQAISRKRSTLTPRYVPTMSHNPRIANDTVSPIMTWIYECWWHFEEEKKMRNWQSMRKMCY